MLATSEGLSSFSIDNLAAAREFYGGTRGLEVREEHGMLRITLGAGPIHVVDLGCGIGYDTRVLAARDAVSQGVEFTGLATSTDSWLTPRSASPAPKTFA